MLFSKTYTMKKQVKKILFKALLYISTFVLLVAFAVLAQINVIVVFLLVTFFAYIKITESKKVKKTNIIIKKNNNKINKINKINKVNKVNKLIK